MSEFRDEIKKLSREFEDCGNILLAIGDETRQHILLEMMKMGQCGGIRIGTIAEKTNLSRSAVSHHIRILKDAGVLKMRREGTKNYYYFDPDMEFINKLLEMLDNAKKTMERSPCLGKENCTEEI